MRKTKFRAIVPAFVLASSLAIAGCHSHHIDSTIDNRTGTTIHQVEVDYPSASFGINTLTAGQIYPYRFKVQGEGQLKVSYTDSDGKQVHLQGTRLAEGDQGLYLIILLPDGKAQWVPSLNVKN
ncbi:MAG: hypothetical protein ABR928_05820 [Terracidiphilus sp.]|jgi:hypothetical protein